MLYLSVEIVHLPSYEVTPYNSLSLCLTSDVIVTCERLAANLAAVLMVTCFQSHKCGDISQMARAGTQLLPSIFLPRRPGRSMVSFRASERAQRFPYRKEWTGVL